MASITKVSTSIRVSHKLRDKMKKQAGREKLYDFSERVIINGMKQERAK